MAALAEHILQPGLDDAQVLGMVNSGDMKAVDFLLVASLDHHTIARRYRELAGQVHPDKLHGPGWPCVQFACWLPP